MNQEIELYERIEAYLKNMLPEAERILFEKQLWANPVLSKQVELHRVLHGIISDGAYLNMKNQLQSVHHKKTYFQKTIKKFLGFGSGVIVIGLTAFVIAKTNAEKKDQTENHAIPTSQLAIKTEDGLTSNTDPHRDTPGNTQASSESKNIKENPKLFCDSNLLPTSTIPQIVPEELNSSGPDTSSNSFPDAMQVDQIMPVTDTFAPPIKHTGIAPNEEKRGTDCVQVRIEASMISNPSCNNKPTGSIEIDKSSITGGEPPYQFSLDENTYINTVLFSALSPGCYPIYAKDANDCKSSLGNVIIGTEDCTYQAVFAPLNGETWTVPVEQDKEGTLLIYSNTGSILYNIPVYGNDPVTWNGETLGGQILPMGLYHFDIRYTDGSFFSGNVTIVR